MDMKKMKIMAVALLLTVCNTTFAQYDDYGYYQERRTTHSSYSSDIDYEDGWSNFYAEYNNQQLVTDHKGVDNMTFHGFTIGYSYNYLFGGSPVGIEGGFEASGAYFSEKYENSNLNVMERHSVDIYYSKLLANLIFKLDVADGFSIIPFGGFNAKINISAEERYKNSQERIVYNLFDDRDMFDEGYNRFQAGYQAGVKLLFQDTFYLGGTYKADLTPFYSDAHEKQRFRGFAITLGISF